MVYVSFSKIKKTCDSDCRRQRTNNINDCNYLSNMKVKYRFKVVKMKVSEGFSHSSVNYSAFSVLLFNKETIAIIVFISVCDIVLLAFVG